MSQDPSTPADNEPERGQPTWRLVGQFFLIPLVIVTIAVGTSWLALTLLFGGEKSSLEYLQEIRHGYESKRFQAAYELANRIRSGRGIDELRPHADVMVEIFEAKDQHPQVRQFMAQVMGLAADRRAVPALIRAIDDEDDMLRIQSMIALGRLGDSAAVPELAARLQDDDPGIRKVAAYALGELSDPSAAPALRPLLEDISEDVRWNSANALARMGDAAAVPELERMFDRERLEQLEGVTSEHVRQVLVNGLSASTGLDAEGLRRLRPSVERLSTSDPDLAVRRAALELLDRIDSP